MFAISQILSGETSPILQIKATNQIFHKEEGGRKLPPFLLSVFLIDRFTILPSFWQSQNDTSLYTREAFYNLEPQYSHSESLS